MAMIKIESKNDFDSAIKQGTTLVDFNAQWCGPCKMLMPHVVALSDKTAGVKFLDVDVDANQNLAAEYEIMSIPALLLFKDGKVVKKHIGFMDPNSLQEFVK